MPRLVHLLAHHPDFSATDRDDDDLLNFSVYFSYYFESVVSAESLTLVYHYCQRIKQVSDAVFQSDADRDVTKQPFPNRVPALTPIVEYLFIVRHCASSHWVQS